MKSDERVISRIILVIASCLIIGVAHAESSLNYRLLVASSRGEAAQVKKLLDKGAAVNSFCGPLSAIIAAAMNGREEVTRMLLARGANVNGRSANGPTALIEAAAKSLLGVVHTLMLYGADTNVRAAFVVEHVEFGGDSCKDLALLRAVEERCLDDERCVTALSVAKSPKIREILVQHGAKELGH
jgi:ankyrin repeat protein